MVQLIVDSNYLSTKTMDLYFIIKNELLAEFQKVEDILINLYTPTSTQDDTQNNPIYQRAYLHIIKSGGKRIRVLLTLLFANIYNNTTRPLQNKDILNFAAGIELIHTASLLHDDVIDDSSIRRSQETVNYLMGNKVSIITGDMIVIKAFSIICECGNLELMQYVTCLAHMLAKGEMLQLQMIGNYNISFLAYIRIIIYKTSSLFILAARGTQMLVDKSENHLTGCTIIDIGRNIGIIFQLTDDYLDYSGGLNKNRFDDFKNKNITLPLIILLRQCSAGEKKELLLYLSKKEPISDDYIDFMQELLSKYKIMQKVQNVIERYKNKTESLLDKLTGYYNTKYIDIVKKTLAYLMERIG